jgi:hypothetical protein
MAFAVSRSTVQVILTRFCSFIIHFLLNISPTSIYGPFAPAHGFRWWRCVRDNLCIAIEGLCMACGRFSIRKDAILSLRWPQVDLHAGVIDFNLPGRAPTKKQRGRAPIPDQLLPHLVRARRRGSDLGPVLRRRLQTSGHRRRHTPHLETHGSHLANAERQANPGNRPLPRHDRENPDRYLRTLSS